jgi:hypothetical protein
VCHGPAIGLTSPVNNVRDVDGEIERHRRFTAGGQRQTERKIDVRRASAVQEERSLQRPECQGDGFGLLTFAQSLIPAPLVGSPEAAPDTRISAR